jgi:hypothetical protein
MGRTVIRTWRASEAYLFWHCSERGVFGWDTLKIVKSILSSAHTSCSDIAFHIIQRVLNKA